MGRSFPFSRGSHPPPPLYPDGQSGSPSSIGIDGVLAGKIELGTTTHGDTQVPITVSFTDSSPRGSTAAVKLTAIGCKFVDDTTSKTKNLASGSATWDEIVRRPAVDKGQGVVIAEFVANRRAEARCAIDISPLPLPPAGDPDAVLGTEGIDPTLWVRTETPKVRSITAKEQVRGKTVLATEGFGCNGAGPSSAQEITIGALPALPDITDLDSAAAAIGVTMDAVSVALAGLESVKAAMQAFGLAS